MSTQSPTATPPLTPAEQFRAVIEKTIEIDAPPELIFESILEEMRTIPDGKGAAMKFVVEPFPGGRWFRDLGNDAGHFWGHVQVIKPPMLLEIFGPLMVSSARHKPCDVSRVHRRRREHAEDHAQAFR